MRHPRHYMLLYIKGVGMGLADVVPGISGGSIALITGIYEELIQSIKNIDIVAFRHLTKKQIKFFWRKINGSFLLAVTGGIMTGVFFFSQIISTLIKEHPIILWSFFFGLILFSTPLILRHIKWHITTWVAIVCGASMVYYITMISPLHYPTTPFTLFLTGTLAICAMILPGISGALILLLLGQYTFLIDALKNLDLVVIACFGTGCVVGLVVFSRLLTWLLHQYKSITLALLAGFMLGSLHKVWPWQVMQDMKKNPNRDAIATINLNVWPQEYFEITGENPLIGGAIFFVLLAAIIIMLLNQKIKMTKRTP